MAGRVASLRGLHRLVCGAVRPGVSKWVSTTAPRQLPKQLAVPAAAAASRPSFQEQWRRPEMVQYRCYGAGGPSVSASELQDQVLNVLKMFDKINPDKVTLEAHFVNDLGLDSLDVVEIVMAFEDEFGIEIDDDQAEKIFTAGDAVEFLKVKLDIKS